MDFPAVLHRLDQFAFGADRRFLLQDFLSRPGTLAFGSSRGLALLRRGSSASHIGPVIAEPADGDALVIEAIRAASGRVKAARPLRGYVGSIAGVCPADSKL